MEMEFSQVCDARMDEGLRYRKDPGILPCIPAHMKNLTGDYSAMIEMREREWNTLGSENSLQESVTGLWGSLMRISIKPRKW